MTETDPLPLVGIAIIGLAGQFPGAPDIEAFWENLRAGAEGISFFSREESIQEGVEAALVGAPNYVPARGILADIQGFDAGYFGFTPRDAEITDPQQRLFLECAQTALEHAGYDAQRYPGAIGIYAGVNLNTYVLRHLYTNPELMAAVGGYQVGLANDKDFIATRVSYKLNLRGPSMTVQTACSTALVATSLACQALLNYQCDLALAGGVTIQVPQKMGHVYTEGGILSPDGHCRTFDAQARGTVGGNGLGVVVLKRLEDALADGDTIWAVIRGWALNNDGAFKVGFTAPSVDGQAEVIAAAQALADVEPETISYVEAHGTATPIGDPIEVAALTRVFRARTERKNFCALGSVKSNIGHLDAAAGVAGLIKTVLALKHKELPPSLHYTAPNASINFADSPFYVNATLRAWETPAGQPRRAGVSAFGIGGTNAHLVLEEAPPPVAEAQPARAQQVLVLSAKTSSALEALSTRFADYLAQASEPLADIAYTMQVGRRVLEYRRAVVGRELSEWRAALMDPRAPVVGPAASAAPLVFLFPGQGAQYVGMAGGLYQTEVEFRAIVDECAEHLRPFLGQDLRAVLFAEPDTAANEALQQTQITQPALFVVEYALARLLMGWGLQPQALLGHSIGEYVAACLAGVFDLPDALTLVAARGRLMAAMAPGAMLSVPLAAQAVEEFLKGDVSLAAVNGPQLCVLSGPTVALEACEQTLVARGVAARRLRTSHAFHSAMMEPLLADFEAEVARVPRHAPQLPILANLSGRWLSEAEATDPAYWTAHLRHTVRFADDLNTLWSERTDWVFVEVGPGRTLTQLARQQLNVKNMSAFVNCLPMAQERQPAESWLWNAVGRLWVLGATVDWVACHAEAARRRVPLPTYPFEHKRYWIEARPIPGALQTSAPAPSPLARLADPADWYYVPQWSQSEGVQTAPHQPGEVWVVFVGTDALSAAVVAQLQAEGRAVIRVVPGAHFSALGPDHYAVRPTDSADYDALLRASAEKHAVPTHFVHLWGVPVAERLSRNVAEFDEYQQNGLYSLVVFLQACHARQIKGGHLAVVTTQAQAVSTQESVQPEKVPALALARVLPFEWPQLTCQTIDVDPAWALHAESAQALAVIVETRLAAPEGMLAYRGLTRWILSYNAVRLGKADSSTLPIRAGGVYLLTGGLGGIGLALAEVLARTPPVTLILTGRTPLPQRAEWATLIQAGDEKAARLKGLLKLEEAGCTVWPVVVDAGDQAGMQALVNEILARYGALHGVIALAGAVGEAELFTCTVEAMAEGVRSKAWGALVLEALCADLPLDFFVVCSSMRTATGGPGIVDYTAANLGLNAVALYRARRGHRAIAINWCAWKDTGMSVTSLRRSGRDPESVIGEGLTTAEGQDAFMRVMASALPQVYVTTQSLAAQIEHGRAFSTALGRLAQGGAEPEARQASAAPPTRHTRPDLSSAYVAPRTESEAQIALVWQELFGIAPIGIHDNFFELGGDSLLAMRVMARLQNGFDVPVRALFDAQTVAELAPLAHPLAATVTEAVAVSAEAVPAARPALLPLSDAWRVTAGDAQVAPLSYAQQRLWYLEQLTPGTALFNVPIAFQIQGALEIEVLTRAINALVARHAIFRTTFFAKDGEPHQRVAEHLTLSLATDDLRALSEAARAAALAKITESEANYLFDLGTGPLLRARLIRLADEVHVLIFVMHHIVSDGWSGGVFIRDLVTFWQAFSAGQVPVLPVLPIQYIDFAVWQREWLRGAVREQQMAYWKRQLAGVSELLPLPYDHARPATASTQGGAHVHILPASLSASLKGLAQRYDVTLFMVLLAAYDVLLARLSGTYDFAVGIPIANRNRPEVEGVIGFFVNMLPLRVDLTGDPTFGELAARVRAVTLEAYAHQDLPFEMLVEGLGLARNISTPPLFQTSLVFQNAPMPVIKQEQFVIQALEIAPNVAKFDLTFTLVESMGELRLTAEYSAALFEPETVATFCERYERLLAQIVAAPERRMSAWDLLAPAERTLLLTQWGVGSTPEPWGRDVLAAVAAYAERTPTASAVVAQGGTLSYLQLDTRANAFAQILREAGVGPETIVGVCLGRDVWLPSVLLGILRAGGAYLPLDPEYPAERLGFMLADAGVKLIITEQALVERVPPGAAQVWVCEALTFPAQAVPQVALAGPEHLAYVIYTSGSTGRPKGVAITRHNLAHYLHWCEQDYLTAGGHGALVHSSIAFDLTVTGLFAPWLVGQAVTLLSGDNAAQDLTEALRQARDLSLVKLTPAHLTWVEHGLAPQAAAGRTRALVIGGEALTAEQTAFWQKHAPATRLINEYGPTETTVGCCIYTVPQAGTAASGVWPIGRPIAHTQLYVLDRQMHLVPPGVTGELYIGGRGVGRGYLGRPDLTAARFVPDPFSAVPGARLYRTGDLVRWGRAGELEFLGRVDEQVKLRGFRIELGEIETILRQHPLVGEAAVVVREERAGDKRLVAYLTARTDTQAVAWASVREWLQSRLPEYMIPAVGVVLATMPLTVNGKIARAALPAPSTVARVHEAPATYVEQTLASLWQEILGVEQISRTDNFFELGGNSLLSLQVLARAQAAGITLTPREFLQTQTLRELAAQARLETQQLAGATMAHATPAALLTPVRIVTLQVGRAKQSLFCVHPASGDVLVYYTLAKYIGADYSVYGFETLGLTPSEPLLIDRIEYIAARYVATLRMVQPEGPYYLVGWSAGGTIAFEMAQQLTQQGLSVALVTLIDPGLTRVGAEQADSLVQGLVGRYGWMRPFAQAPLGSLALHGGAAALNRLLAEPIREQVDTANRLSVMLMFIKLFEEIDHVTLGLTHTQLAALDEPARWALVEATLRTQGVDGAEARTAQIRRMVEIVLGHSDAVLRYQPKPYSGKVLFLYARETAPDMVAVPDPRGVLRGWEAYLKGPSVARAVSGHHLVLMRDPYVREVAEVLRMELEGRSPFEYRLSQYLSPYAAILMTAQVAVVMGVLPWVATVALHGGYVWATNPGAFAGLNLDGPGQTLTGVLGLASPLSWKLLLGLWLGIICFWGGQRIKDAAGRSLYWAGGVASVVALFHVLVYNTVSASGVLEWGVGVSGVILLAVFAGVFLADNPPTNSEQKIT